MAQHSFCFISRPAALVLALFLSAACESKVDIIVHATSLPDGADGLEFLVRQVEEPMRGMPARQTAALSPPNRISFADAPLSAPGEYSFALYLSPPPETGKVQVSVAALRQGCPIATGANDINPPFGLQQVSIDLHPTEAVGSAAPTIGCTPGQPQIFAIVRSTTQVNGNPEDLRIGLHGWNFYPDSLAFVYLSDADGMFTSEMAKLPVPLPPMTYSDDASEFHAIYDAPSYPGAIQAIREAFSGVRAIKITIVNPNGQSNTALFFTR